MSIAPSARAAWPGWHPPAGDVVYLGRATLTCPDPTGAQVRFRGRLLRHRATGVHQFVVHRLPTGGVPADWPHQQEWVPLTDLTGIEWVGPGGPA